MNTKSLSRDAEIVAYALFHTGKPSQVIFNRPHIMHSRTHAALDELTQAGMLKPIDARTLARGAMGWQATDKMGIPLRDLQAPTKDESFPVTTE